MSYGPSRLPHRLHAGVSRAWVGAWVLLAVIGVVFVGWWAFDALFGDDCTSLIARRDRSMLFLGVVAVGTSVGAWFAAKIAPALFRSNRGQLAYLVGVTVVMTVALIARDSVAQWPIIDQLLGHSVACGL